MSDEFDFNYGAEAETADANTPQYKNYLLMRWGITEHIRAGRFDAIGWAVFSSLLLWADFRSGICDFSPAELSSPWRKWRVFCKADDVA
jgi:hypothetical protein